MLLLYENVKILREHIVAAFVGRRYSSWLVDAI